MIKYSKVFINFIGICLCTLAIILLTSCTQSDPTVTNSTIGETIATSTDIEVTASTDIKVKTSNDTKATTGTDIKDENISFSYTIEDDVKDVDTEIIDAAKQAIQDFTTARHNKFQSNSNYIDFFEVQEDGADLWTVEYRIKGKKSEEYEMKSFAFVFVEKQKSGDYKGYIVGGGLAKKSEN